MNSCLTHCTLCRALMNHFSSRGEPLSPASFPVCQHPCLLPPLVQLLRPSSIHFQGLPRVGSGKDTGKIVLCLGSFSPQMVLLLFPISLQEGPGSNFSLLPFPPNECWLWFVNKGTATHLKQLVHSFFRVHPTSEKLRGSSWTCSVQLHCVIGL